MPGYLGNAPLAGAIKPMEPESAAAPPGDPSPEVPPPGHPLVDPRNAAQVKWDGVRMLAFLDRGEVRLQNRGLRDRTPVYPDLIRALSTQVRARAAILDGEVFVLGEGQRPSFPRVLRRDLAGIHRVTEDLMQELPAFFAAFDILFLDGDDLTARPWWARQELLQGCVNEGGPLHLTRNYDDGPALFAAVAGEGLEGVVMKNRQGLYLPGKKSSLWVKVKLRRRTTCVVAGFTVSGGRLAALVCGMFDEGGLRYVGRVGSGLGEEDRDVLRSFLSGLAITEPPFAALPGAPDAPRASRIPRVPAATFVWVEPVITIDVEFAEWTDDLRLRAPVFKGVSRRKPEECRL